MITSLCRLWSHSLVLGPGCSCYTRLDQNFSYHGEGERHGCVWFSQAMLPSSLSTRMSLRHLMLSISQVQLIVFLPNLIVFWCVISINTTLILSIESSQKPGHLYTRFPLTCFSDPSPHPVDVTVKSLSHPFSVSSLVHVTCVIARSSAFVSFQQDRSLWPVCQHLPWPISSLVLAPRCLARYTSHCSRRRTNIFHIIWKLSAHTLCCLCSSRADLLQSLYHDLSCVLFCLECTSSPV